MWLEKAWVDGGDVEQAVGAGGKLGAPVGAISIGCRKQYLATLAM